MPFQELILIWDEAFGGAKSLNMNPDHNGCRKGFMFSEHFREFPAKSIKVGMKWAERFKYR